MMLQIRGNGELGRKDSQRDYKIKHTNMLPTLIPFIFVCIILIIAIGVWQWKGLFPMDTWEDKCMLILIYGMVVGIAVFFLIYGLYTKWWELQINGDIILHTNWRGKQTQYRFSDITKCIDNNFDCLCVYSSNKRLFLLEKYEKYWFEIRVKELGIPVEYKHNKTLENHIVRAMMLVPGFEIIAGVFCGMIGMGIILEDKNNNMAIPIFCLAAAGIIGAVRQWANRLVVCGNKLYYHGFLRKKKEYNIKEITEIQILGEKNGDGRRQYVFFSGKKCLFKFKAAEYMIGIELFEQRMAQEKIKWKVIE